jgi:hypothetical protein
MRQHLRKHRAPYLTSAVRVATPPGAPAALHLLCEAAAHRSRETSVDAEVAQPQPLEPTPPLPPAMPTDLEADTEADADDDFERVAIEALDAMDVFESAATSVAAPTVSTLA